MLVISPDQLVAFRAAAVRECHRRFESHLRKYFPHRCAAFTSAGLADIIAHGASRAAHHGIFVEREVCRYLNLMFAFGRDFDRDEPWAQDVLAQPGDDAGAVLLDALLVSAQANLHRARGIVPAGEMDG